MKPKLLFLFAIFFVVITFSTATLQAHDVDNNTLAKANKLVADEHSGFWENKGQLLNQQGNVRHDILYYYEDNNLNIYLKPGGMSYEFKAYERRPKDRKNVDRIQNTFPKRFYAAFDSLDYYNTILKTHRVDIEFVGANKTPEIVTEGISEDYNNYYGPYTPADGITYVHYYQKVTYKNIYPNIDLVYYVNSNNDSQTNVVNYDFVIKPGGIVSDIKLAYYGMDSLTIDEDGRLNVKTTIGSLEEHIPISYQCEEIHAFAGMTEKDLGMTSKVPVQYELCGNVLTFSVGDYDKSKTLVIDPRLIWGTYFGKSWADQAFAVAVDKINNIVITGVFDYRYPVYDPPFYTLPQDSLHEFGDAFILKLDSNGNKKWCTYYGKRDEDTLLDFGSGIACFDSDKSIAVAGITYDTIGIATPGAYQTNKRGLTDVWLARFDSNGIRKWATYYGGDGAEGSLGYGVNLCINRKGDILMTGRTNSPNGIATPGAYKTILPNNVDAFIVRFDSSGNLKWGTYYGMDSVEDYGTAITSDQFCNIYVTGVTYSKEGLATPGTYKYSNCDSHNSDAFVVKFDSAGTRIWGTYYGGCSNDMANDIITDGWGNVVITGNTESVDSISTPNSMQAVYGGGVLDAFLAKLDINGRLLWGTYYGGDSIDMGLGLTQDKHRNIILTGITNSQNNIATPCTYKPTPGGSLNQFLAQFGPDGDIQWGTYYADSTYGWPVGGDVVTIDKNGDIILVGGTASSYGVATPGAYQTQIDTTHHPGLPPKGYYQVIFDSFIAKFGVFPFNFEAKLKKDEIQYASACLVAGPVRGPYCVGEQIVVPFTTFIDFDSGNVFTAILSNKNGDFINTFTIGTKAGISSDTITGTLPADLPFGTGYRVMVTGSAPPTVSEINPFDITISSGFGVDTIVGPFCAGETIQVPYSACLQFADSNVFTAQLSDYEGNFSNSVDIGSIEAKSSSIITSTIPKNTVTGTGYRIRVVASNPQLTSNDNGTNIIINALPTPDFTGPNEICFGRIITYNALQDSDFINKWYIQNGEFVGADTGQSVLVKWKNKSPSVLKLVQTNAITGCTNSITKDISVATLNMPDSLGDNPVCSDIILTYKAPASQYLLFYNWLVTGGTVIGSATDSVLNLTWDKAGTGDIKLILGFHDDPECKDSIQQTFTIMQSPAVTLDSIPSVCSNAPSFYLTEGKPDGGTYSGPGVMELGLFYPDVAGEGSHTITYTYTGSNGCTIIKSQALTVERTPTKPQITRKDKTLISSADYGNQWYYDGKIISGAVDKLYAPQKYGRYSIQVTDSNGCKSEFSEVYNYTVSVPEASVSNLIKIYPNPAESQLFIEINTGDYPSADFKLYNVLGEAVLNSRINLNGNKTTEMLNLKDEPGGVYLLTIKLGNNLYYRKIIVSH